jgi:hypothetical protein
MEPATATLVKLRTPEPNVKTDALVGADKTVGVWSASTSTTARVGDGNGANTKANAWWAATSTTAGIRDGSGVASMTAGIGDGSGAACFIATSIKTARGDGAVKPAAKTAFLRARSPSVLNRSEESDRMPSAIFLTC